MTPKGSKFSTNTEAVTFKEICSLTVFGFLIKGHAEN